MRILCVFGQHNYGNPDRGEGYEYTNFIPALRLLNHEVHFFESWNRTCYRDFRKLNEHLLRTVETIRPDVVFSVLMHYEIWMETWEILRDAGISAILNWTTDDSWKYSQFSRLVAPAFHAFTTTYPEIYSRYNRDGILNVILSQWGASVSNLQPPLPASSCQYPVSFVGTAHGRRRAWVDALHQKNINITCFGHGWPNGPIPAINIPQIIRNSIISLNFANSRIAWNGVLPQQSKQIKARTFEVPGAGGFLLTEWADGLDRYFIQTKEIEVFYNFNELADKIRYYLANPARRDSIAQAGYERTRSEHTYDRRLAQLLSFARLQYDKYFESKGISPSGQIDWTKFNEAARRHVMNRKARHIKHMLVHVCSAIWGPIRGPRAARRLVFEISLRLVGARTYSASGWPGRMFYEVS